MSYTRLLAFLCVMAPVAAGLSACSGIKSALDPDSAVVSYEYRPPLGYVRIERIEAGAPANSHPFRISVDALKQALTGLEVEGGLSRRTSPLFSEAELEEIAPHLAGALAKAGPGEDVTFAVTGKRGFLGALSSSSATTGRVFARDQDLNIVFGLVQYLYEPNELQSQVPVFVPGSRAGPSGRSWGIVPKSGRLAGKRTDWVILEVTASPAPREKAGAPLSPAVEDRHREIKNRLGLLDRLRADGSITQEEYEERRRVILQGL